MQKSRNATIIIIFGILIFGLLGSLKLIREINLLYLYIINPISWILLCFILYFLLGKNTENKKLRKEIIQYSIIASLTFIIINMLSGLVVTFGSNPYNTTLKGLIHNFWTIGVVLIAKEYVRYKLINNVYDKNKKTIAILISIVYIIIDIEFYKFTKDNFSIFLLVKYILDDVVIKIAKNIVFSYTAMNSDCWPGIIYEILTNLYYWISPIIPNEPWVMTAIINVTIPTILFLYIRYTKNKLNIYKSRQDLINSDPKNIIVLVFFIILAIWFALRNFSYKTCCNSNGQHERRVTCR